jgi:ribose 5-phosphate isomerase B
VKVAFGADHAGHELRDRLLAVTQAQGHTVAKFGAENDDPYDYPQASNLVAEEIIAGTSDCGVLICGTGIGVSIRANRYYGIRAALCCSAASARLAREHNHANVLCLGSRTQSADEAEAILKAFLDTAEDQADRHVRRVKELDADVPTIRSVEEGSQ